MFGGKIWEYSMVTNAGNRDTENDGLVREMTREILDSEMSINGRGLRSLNYARGPGEQVYV